MPLHPRPFHKLGTGGPPLSRGEDGLDSHWDRRLKGGTLAPDFTLDLHGHTLDSAYARLEDGLFQAKAMGARVVLLIAGKSRPVDAADRGTKRGVIRAKILDWLAAGPHGSDVAAIRKAHRRHGGEGALYLVLKRRR
ncbi:Smr/MutS family protein [Pelagerythrobacter sp.]|uniref:Smr/MutS family protein n=1 Tax=Pelagerythrobacter sp. TaxID=2800702 RepID=UPI0035B1CD09